MADENERTLRRLAEAEAQTLRTEVERLAYECTRLSRKLDHLTTLLYDVRALPELDEQWQLRVEDALAFDGRAELASVEGWPDFDLAPDESDEPSPREP